MQGHVCAAVPEGLRYQWGKGWWYWLLVKALGVKKEAGLLPPVAHRCLVVSSDGAAGGFAEVPRATVDALVRTGEALVLEPDGWGNHWIGRYWNRVTSVANAFAHAAECRRLVVVQDRLFPPPHSMDRRASFSCVDFRQLAGPFPPAFGTRARCDLPPAASGAYAAWFYFFYWEGGGDWGEQHPSTYWWNPRVPSDDAAGGAPGATAAAAAGSGAAMVSPLSLAYKVFYLYTGAGVGDGVPYYGCEPCTNEERSAAVLYVRSGDVYSTPEHAVPNTNLMHHGQAPLTYYTAAMRIALEKRGAPLAFILAAQDDQSPVVPALRSLAARGQLPPGAVLDVQVGKPFEAVIRQMTCSATVALAHSSMNPIIMNGPQANAAVYFVGLPASRISITPSWPEVYAIRNATGYTPFTEWGNTRQQWEEMETFSVGELARVRAGGNWESATRELNGCEDTATCEDPTR